MTDGAVRRRPKRFLDRPSGRWTVRLVTFVVLLVAWQLYAGTVSLALLASPTQIAEAFYEQAFVEGTLWAPLGESLLVLFTGLALSLLIGIPVGLAMGRWKPISDVLSPYVTFLYALPHVAMVPLMVILLGFDFQFRLGYVVFSAVWPAIINTMAGVTAVPKELIDCARAYDASERQIMRGVILPAAAPLIIAGARQSFSMAWVGVVVSEILSTLVGLGGQIKIFSIQFQTADMLVAIILIMLIATAIQGSAGWLQQRLTPWQAHRRLSASN
ncbi:ABC transporter permease [Dactylosporangium sp. AC04546]|uniref:ABC transporter permease n=1 Tax=Dactylosporangium sp. AC04546 TaxID=2862460 RepID=UPI001EDF5BE3|nr:ABC transporter permease [Dactylosporangium sp. AC04546]WVK78758.1 ABC transporter permease [Dactylosporangium sp. AC04546]